MLLLLSSTSARPATARGVALFLCGRKQRTDSAGLRWLCLIRGGHSNSNKDDDDNKECPAILNEETLLSAATTVAYSDVAKACMLHSTIQASRAGSANRIIPETTTTTNHSFVDVGIYYSPFRLGLSTSTDLAHCKITTQKQQRKHNGPTWSSMKMCKRVVTLSRQKQGEISTIQESPRHRLAKKLATKGGLTFWSSRQ